MSARLRRDKKQETFIPPDDSYALARRVLHAPDVGLVVDGSNAVPLAVTALQEALAGEDMVGDGVEASAWYVGRSAQAISILLVSAGSVITIAAGIKTVDEAVDVLRKWWRAIKRARDKVDAQCLTMEALKLACIDNMAEHYGRSVAPDLDRIVAAASAAQYGDGTWRPTGPAYIAIPDRKNDRTYLYVVGLDGTVIHHAVLPFFQPDDLEQFRRGPLSDAASADEQHGSGGLEEDWDDGPGVPRANSLLDELRGAGKERV